MQKKVVIIGLFWGLVVWLFFSSTLTQPFTNKLVLTGKIPPQMQLQAFTSFATNSPLCRSFSFGSGNWLHYGTGGTTTYASVDAETDTYSIDIPIEDLGLFCSWRLVAITLRGTHPYDKSDTGETYGPYLGTLWEQEDGETEATVTCVKTTYVRHFYNDPIPHFKPQIFCSDKLRPSIEVESKQQLLSTVKLDDVYSFYIGYQPGAKEFRLDIYMQDAKDSMDVTTEQERIDQVLKEKKK